MGRRVTPAELALLGLAPGAPLPVGGLIAQATYETGNGSSGLYLPDLERLVGQPLHPGSFNLRLRLPLELPNARGATVLGATWLLAPVVLSEDAVGFLARRQLDYAAMFGEVFSPVGLALALGVSPGDTLALRVLDGSQLRGAA